MRVKLELEDLEPKDGMTWRAHWPQEQPWRSLSWRAHQLAESRREEEAELEAMALEAALAEEARINGAACAIESGARSFVARRRVRELRRERQAEMARMEALAAAKEAEEAAAAEARKGRQRSKDPSGKEAPAGKGGKSPKETPAKGKPAKDGKKDAKPSKEPSKEGKDPKESSKDSAKDKEPKEAPTGKGKQPKGESKDKQQNGRPKDAAAAEAAAAKEADAAIRVQALMRGAAARRAAKARAAAAASPSAAPTTRKGKKTSLKLSRKVVEDGAGSKRSYKGKMASPKISPTKSGLPRAGPGAESGLTSPSRALTVKNGSPRNGSPRGMALNIHGPELHGWITLAEDNDVFVSKQVGRLPLQFRQQQLQLWSRSAAIDSDRERERAKFIGEANEAAVTRSFSPPKGGTDDMVLLDKPFKDTGSPRRHLLINDGTTPVSPRSRYSDLVTRTDNSGDARRASGFAYGGVFPGKRDVRGPPVENHEVRFSVGVAGSYLLFVSLRKPHTPWESATSKTKGQPSVDDWQIKGSPFVIHVSPGKAYPLSTSLTPKPNEQLRGVRDPGDRERYSFERVLQTRDKMGNVCDTGGAAVTCGFLGMGSSSGSVPPTIEATGAADEQLVIEPPAEEKQTATCNDDGNGSYKLKWVSATPGAFTVYVKIDGLHVIGSPARMVFLKGESPKPKAEKPEPKAGKA